MNLSLMESCTNFYITCHPITALVVANKDFSPVVNTWADTDVILAAPLNQLASCNSEFCEALLQLVGII